MQTQEQFLVEFETPRSKPDHDPHGEVNTHLSSWTCPNCGQSGMVRTHTLDMIHLESDDDAEIRCEHCA